VKIVLLPSKEVECKPSKGYGKNLLAKKEFVDEMLASEVVFVLLGKESSKEGVVPEAMRGLLEEFDDVFTKDLQKGYHLQETYIIRLTWCQVLIFPIGQITT
jgi:hypothetical protein